MSRSYPGVLLYMRNLNVLFVLHATEVECVRRTDEILPMRVSTASDIVDLSRCCMPCPFNSFYQIREVETWDQNLGFVRQISKVLLVCWYKIDLFAVPPARR